MCIIIYKPLKTKIPKTILQNCFFNNTDGGGYMYAEDGDLVIKKGFFSFGDFYKSYEEDKNKSNMVIHFRISTHGSITKKNCHPFYINDKLGFAHNGILDIDVAKGSKRSDTNQFNFEILKRLPDDFLSNSAVMTLIEDFIGTDKLVFLDGEGKGTIVNEVAGEWSADTDGETAWFSNSSFKWQRTAVSYDFSNYGVGTHGNGLHGYVEDYNKYGKYGNNTKGMERDKLTKCDWCCSYFNEKYSVFYIINGDMVCNTCHDVYKNALPINSDYEKDVVRLDPLRETKTHTGGLPTIEAGSCIIGESYILYPNSTVLNYKALAECIEKSEKIKTVKFKLITGKNVIYVNPESHVGLLGNLDKVDIAGNVSDDKHVGMHDDDDNIGNVILLDDGISTEYLKDTPGVYTKAKNCIVHKMYVVDNEICQCSYVGGDGSYVVTFTKENGGQVFADLNDEVLLIDPTELTGEDYEQLFSDSEGDNLFDDDEKEVEIIPEDDIDDDEFGRFLDSEEEDFETFKSKRDKEISALPFSVEKNNAINNTLSRLDIENRKAALDRLDVLKEPRAKI